MDAHPQDNVEDPELQPAFQAMRVAAAGRPERSMGTAVIPAEVPRWADVRVHAAGLDPAAVHLEVLLTLARAALALDGFAGLAGALESLAGHLDERWHALWPVADEDDPDEPWYARGNLLADFLADDAFDRALLETPLVDVRGIGAFSARDLDVAAGLVDADEAERARCQGGLVDGAFSEAPLESLVATRDALDGAESACRQGADALEREIGAGGGAPLVTLAERLGGVRARFETRAGSRLVAAAPAANDAGGGPDVGEPAAGTDSGTVAVPGGTDADAAAASATTLADQDAVRATLAGVLGYYRRHEPGSPVAVLVARSREMVGQGFFELLGTLCPAGDGGGSLAERIAAPRPDPLATLLVGGFDAHVAGAGADTAALHDGAGEPGDAPASDTRDEVVRALDDVLAFYRAREPSSPVPLVLTRARALVPLDFDGVLDALGKVLAAAAPPVADD